LGGICSHSHDEINHAVLLKNMQGEMHDIVQNEKELAHAGLFLIDFYPLYNIPLNH